MTSAKLSAASDVTTSRLCRQQSGDTEEPLVRAAQQDPAAFAEIYEANYAAIANYIYRRTMDKDVTEDLLSDVFLAAIQQLPKYEYRGVPIRAWLYRIANGAINQRIRRQRREQRKLTQHAEQVRDNGEGPHSSEFEAADVVRLVQTLSPRYQDVIALYYFESMNINQVADVLRVKPGTVKSRLARARKMLHKHLKLTHH